MRLVMQRPDPVYPDAKSNTSFQDGVEFQDFVCCVLAQDGIILQNLSSKKYQFDLGENLQGFEIKLDRRCTETKRLSIEIAEKTKANNATWVASGIFRNDNSWLYIQGNENVIFIFQKTLLKKFFEQRAPKVEEALGTVRKFYLPIEKAEEMAAKTLWLNPRTRFLGDA
jgi:hypothetical protein